MTDAGHRRQELAQPGWIGVDRLEEGEVPRLRLVLERAGAQALGEPAPEGVEPVIGHLEDAADVRRRVPVEEEARLRGVAVHAVLALQEAQRDERVEEVASRSLVQPEPATDGLEVSGMTGELGEEAHLDGAQERLGCPEAQAHLHDVVWCRSLAHSTPPGKDDEPTEPPNGGLDALDRVPRAPDATCHPARRLTRG